MPPAQNFIRNASFFALVSQAGAALVHRPWLYCALAVVAIAVQGIVFALTHGAPWAQLATGIVVASVASSVVYAFVLASIDGESAEHAWLRALERSWAAVVVDFIQTFVGLVGLGSVLQGDLAGRLLGIPVLLLAISMNFADVDAVVSDDDGWWMLVPQALVRSVRATWSGTTMIRAITLVLAQYLAVAVGASLEAPLTHAHVPGAAFWASTLLPTLVAIPLSALTAYVYLDAIGYEPKRSCSE